MTRFEQRGRIYKAATTVVFESKGEEHEPKRRKNKEKKKTKRTVAKGIVESENVEKFECARASGFCWKKRFEFLEKVCVCLKESLSGLVEEKSDEIKQGGEMM